MTEQLRPAPYPADTRAKGWRFELDYEQMEQSDTWSLAAEVPMCQHALLMMWVVAWTQVPCGSFPNDEALIRAKCKVPAKQWPTLREVLMRGWWVAEDGRLYHDTVAARVQEMLDYRRKNAERVAAFKLAKREQRAGNALPTREQQGKNDTGTGTGTGTSSSLRSEGKTKRTRSASVLTQPEGVSEQTWSDWLKLRKDKGATVTTTVLNGAISEAQKAGLSLEAFLTIWCLRGSQGLMAEWIKPDERAAHAGQPKSFQERNDQAARAKVSAWTGGLLGGDPNTLDMEDTHGTLSIR